MGQERCCEDGRNFSHPWRLFFYCLCGQLAMGQSVTMVENRHTSRPVRAELATCHQSSTDESKTRDHLREVCNFEFQQALSMQSLRAPDGMALDASCSATSRQSNPLGRSLGAAEDGEGKLPKRPFRSSLPQQLPSSLWQQRSRKKPAASMRGRRA